MSINVSAFSFIQEQVPYQRLSPILMVVNSPSYYPSKNTFEKTIGIDVVVRNHSYTVNKILSTL